MKRFVIWPLTCAFAAAAFFGLRTAMAQFGPGTGYWIGFQQGQIVTIPLVSTTFTPSGISNNYSIQLVHGTSATIANPAVMSATGFAGTIDLSIFQSSSGSDTVSWGTSYKFPGGTKPTLSTAGNAHDIVSCKTYSPTEADCVLAGAAFQ